jgi:hypothetical protein
MEAAFGEGLGPLPPTDTPAENPMARPFKGTINLDIREPVVFDIADEAYIDVERHMAAAMARD